MRVRLTSKASALAIVVEVPAGPYIDRGPARMRRITKARVIARIVIQAQQGNVRCAICCEGNDLEPGVAYGEDMPVGNRLRGNKVIRIGIP